MGRFYLFFMQLGGIFVTILYLPSMIFHRGTMNKIDILTSSLNSGPMSLSTPEPASRLIVLIPTMDWNYIPALRRIWELAIARGAGVLLLSLYTDTQQELSFRRVLVTMSAMLQDSGIAVEAGLDYGTNWMELVKRNHQMGDTIVCFAGAQTGPLHQPLSQVLLSNLKVPVYVLPSPVVHKPKLILRSQIIGWLGFIGIILGCFMLQMRIVQLPKDAFQTMLLILSLIPEFWLIWAWNSRLG